MNLMALGTDGLLLELHRAITGFRSGGTPLFQAVLLLHLPDLSRAFRPIFKESSIAAALSVSPAATSATCVLSPVSETWTLAPGSAGLTLALAAVVAPAPLPLHAQPPGLSPTLELLRLKDQFLQLLLAVTPGGFTLAPGYGRLVDTGQELRNRPAWLQTLSAASGNLAV